MTGITVKELIKKLQEYDEKLEVVIGEDEWCNIFSIKVDDNGGIQKPVLVIN
jgi:hypothetical protein